MAKRKLKAKCLSLNAESFLGVIHKNANEDSPQGEEKRHIMHNLFLKECIVVIHRLTPIGIKGPYNGPRMHCFLRNVI